MSVTVTAVPTTYLLISGIINALTIGTATTTIGGATITGAILNSELQDFNANYIRTSHFDDVNEEMKSILNKRAEEITKQDIENIISKEYQTPFVDKDLLIKTLEEHGVEDIKSENNLITCSLENFNLEFSKDNSLQQEEKNAFKMKIATNCSEEEIEELVNNINTEYTMNTQEESYIKIKERLEKQGLRINQEEIFEDDSIVLTVNIN